MPGLWIAVAAANALIAVAAGAYATHGLEAEAAGWMETGSRYQMWHALAMLAVLLLARRGPGRLPIIAAWAFLLGIVLFSGSLYVMALAGLRGPGSLAPFGGVSFMAGWAALALYGLLRPRSQQDPCTSSAPGTERERP